MVANAWEERLEAEGLAPIEEGGAWRASSGVVKIARGGGAAAEEYLAWARSVLRSTAFSSPYQRRVWELFSEGKSRAEIVEALKGEEPTAIQSYGSGKTRTVAVRPTRHSVYMALRKVQARAPVCPVPNPWRKNGTGSVAARGASLESLVAKVMSRLRRTSADPEELQRILEAHIMDKNGTIRYARILFTPQNLLKVPGLSVAREFLADIDGRPHAGGIDIVLDTSSPKGVKGKTRFTVPWHAIRQAEVAVRTES